MSDDSRLANPGASDPLAEVEPGAPARGPNRSDLEALKDGAAMMIQAGNRVAAMALLWSAVAIDPTDLASHRRLAATMAHGGDIDGAADEYARYIEFMLPLGEVGRATLELSYGASQLGGHPKLHEAAEKIVTAVRSIVPPSGIAHRAVERRRCVPPLRRCGRSRQRRCPLLPKSSPGHGAASRATPPAKSAVPFLHARRRRPSLDAARGWHR